MEVSRKERNGGEASGRGHMDYCAQVVTSPDSALYNRELSHV